MNSGGLRKKLLLSHMGVAISSLLTIVLLVNLVMLFSLGKYTEEQQQSEAKALLEDLTASYQETTGQWTTEALMSISHQAMLRGYVVRITDRQGTLVWDTSTMGRPVNSDRGTEEAADAASSKRIQKPIVKAGNLVGTLEIRGIEQPFQKLNQQFLNLFNTLLGAALVLVMIGVSLFSIFTANGISRPLLHIKQAAVRMRDGDLSRRVELDDNTEVGEVGRALNHLAEALEKQDKLRKNLTGDIAHELRTPLTTIQSHLEAFQDGVWEATPDKLQVCHDQVIQLVQLISDLEKLTDAENPMLQLRKERVCLNEVIRDGINTVAEPFRYKNIALEVREDQQVYVKGDYSRLVQVIVNLLNNAYKYTNQGKIQVTVVDERFEAKVSIADTGVGIPADELPFIFERFYRGEKSRNRKTGGAGIGLAVAKAIVEANGGKITVRSKINEGSEFTVHFPKK
ncbi:sensor histidine kinase [Gorillibacterium timonense]|uniref:sensor histidine kinase n=1 Tax=Gorillibacterium timonense TaxID=1689269 RepID=UPI00071C27E0|nr:HAMP domain-containing sensor histidine kinase [Gorillibacterium timonense]